MRSASEAGGVLGVVIGRKRTLGAGLMGFAVVSAPALSPGQRLLSGGPPVQVIPYVSEVGVPPLTITPGTPNPFGGLGTPPVTGTPPGSGTPGGGVSGGGGTPVGSSSALPKMMSTSWGVQAVSAAHSVGVNPSVLAGTCQIESGCRNVNNGNAVGPFQMFPAAFSEGIQTALARNPALASQIVPGAAGRADPFTNAVAAAGYQMQAVQYLQSRGIAEPTGLDTRGYYNFGPRFAASIAQAAPTATMGEVLLGVPSSWFGQNGITPETTVGDWRAHVTQRMGGSASQPVLL